MRLYKLLTAVFIVLLTTSVLTSCSDMLDAELENAVNPEDSYKTADDADKAILGIYSQFMKLADRVIVLEELRADLMDVTTNATPDLVDINNHTATASNKWCEIAPFYEVILNCNDALSNFDKMLADNKLSKADYSYRYADVMTVRCWVYLEMATHFGDVYYVTDPLVTIKDLTADKVPVYQFDQLVQELIKCMTSVPTLDLSTDSPLYNQTSDGYLLKLFFLNKKLLLGDLYLWANDYVQAATQYNNFFKEAETKEYSSTPYYAYKLDTWVWDASNEPRFQVCYQRFKGADLNAFRNKWKEIFSRSSTDTELNREMINMVSYDTKFAPTYPLIELFANTGQGKYYLKPSSWAINGLWEAQVQSNDFVFDGRGRESSFDYVNGEPVVLKYLYDYYAQTTDDNKTIHLSYNQYSTDQYSKSGKWFIYRAGLLHLRYAEAANRAGYPDIAYAIINNGIITNYDWAKEDGTLRSDKEGVQYTGYKPLNDTDASVPYPEPFYLDARNNSSPFVTYRSPWYQNAGLRGRASLKNVEKPDWVMTKTDSIKWMEDAIVTENALECGFEGNRWGTLLRIAMRRDKTGENGTAFLNKTLNEKFQAAGKSAPTLSSSNWFLPKNENVEQ
ncbi:RagB/SusD family nutrient uptake outer membrane protein [Dysgonomonas macrotermitis]|uniref:SusD family protein n=1 Tax=Dysgonomonas macrotermitis TaxID=1346286 RepID=A0A1M4XAH9_9BACT|nr:RagB/SusD family nutrient uptake outer membrane protein [Dysgonomonas macrotermitis]SHE90433.1 SusD family protein [Dysgonomonas macrotermitis]